MYMLLEGNGSHACCSVGVGHELRVIFSNAKDEAWSKHKQLHIRESLKNATENDSPCGI
jgi:hypothetical protein